MSFKIQDVSEADFAAVVRCMWYTYEHPLQDLYRIFCPENATGCSTREESIEESIKRFWEWHTSDPTSNWIQVRDDATNEVIGGALWKINKTNPYENAQDEEAYWQPEGGQREFANQVLEQHEHARSQMATRPHVYLNIIFTHPDHQRRGIGQQLLQWGIDKAAELDFELWLNSWKHGRALYEKNGFVTVSHHITKPKTEHPDEAWKAFERELTDMEEWVMWRPKDGPYVEGKSVKPWEAAQ